MKIPTVFLLEDDKDLLEGMCLALQAEDYKVECFSHSAAFILALSKASPQAIVIDVNLPDGQGDLIAQEIKQTHSQAKTPIILISATLDLARKAKQSGADAYLAKPFSLKDLVTTVQSQIQRSPDHE